jgi:hypothetical protein
MKIVPASVLVIPQAHENSQKTSIYAENPAGTSYVPAREMRPSTLPQIKPARPILPSAKQTDLDNFVVRSWLNRSVEVDDEDGRTHVDLTFTRNRESHFYLFADGHVAEVQAKAAPHLTCSDGTEYTPFNLPPIDVTNTDPTKRVVAIMHTHEDLPLRKPDGTYTELGSQEPFPSLIDGQVPNNLGIPNYGLSSKGAWKIMPVSETGTGKIDVRLLYGKYGRDHGDEPQYNFDLPAYRRDLIAGGGSTAGASGVTCKIKE